MSGLTLGSLFDGIGVFPRRRRGAASVPCGQARSRLPLSLSPGGTSRIWPTPGDITKLDGGAIPPVHVLTFGSPCQNLSQIGRREGLDGAKSGLFFHAIRIIQEMRKATNDLYPVISVWGKRHGSVFLQMTGWTLEPSYPLSQTPKFQCLLREDGQTPEWCEGDAPISHGGSWMPNTGQGPRLARRQRVFLVADFGGRRAPAILFKPRPMLPLPAPCTAGGLPAPGGDRGPVLETGGRVPVTRPFQGFRMRGSRQGGEQTAFQNSFGFPTDPFPTLLAGTVTPFAFWYEDDPAGGCIRFPTELEM